MNDSIYSADSIRVEALYKKVVQLGDLDEDFINTKGDEDFINNRSGKDTLLRLARLGQEMVEPLLAYRLSQICIAVGWHAYHQPRWHAYHQPCCHLWHTCHPEI